METSLKILCSITVLTAVWYVVHKFRETIFFVLPLLMIFFSIVATEFIFEKWITKKRILLDKETKGIMLHTLEDGAKELVVYKLTSVMQVDESYRQGTKDYENMLKLVNEAIARHKQGDS